MGIGPEVCAAALIGWSGRPLRIIGRWAPMERAAVAVGLSVTRVDAPDAPAPGGAVPVFDPGDAGEPAEVAAIRLAVRACLAGRAAGLVTGPIHKKRLAAQGFAFRGHTDFLAHLCGLPEDAAVMAFVGGELRVALATVHLPLRAVPAALHTPGIVAVVETAVAALRADLGLAAPRVDVCGLNPHAGEDGLLGDEEQHVIGPACALLRARGLAVRGPVSAETAFLAARQGENDLVVAMYHDQGLAPLKAVDFGRSVNWTVGLPILRTSVDHGTADALVGTGRADPASFRAALRLAAEIADRRAAAP
jgi:4-hydroxythreonine-4-phosphate dehydrogenase